MMLAASPAMARDRSIKSRDDSISARDIVIRSAVLTIGHHRPGPHGTRSQSTFPGRRQAVPGRIQAVEPTGHHDTRSWCVPDDPWP